MFACKFCDKEYDNKISRSNHSRYCKSNPNKITPKSTNRNNQWSNPDYKFSPESLEKISNAGKGKKRSQEFKDNLRKVAFKRKLGGHTSKKNMYFQKKDGTVVYLQSSYEAKMAELLEEHNIPWSRPEPLNWIDEYGKPHRYYPDFKVYDIYFDTKNDYLIKKDEKKLDFVRKQNYISLYVLAEKQINIDEIRNCLIS